MGCPTPAVRLLALPSTDVVLIVTGSVAIEITPETGGIVSAWAKLVQANPMIARKRAANR